MPRSRLTVAALLTALLAAASVVPGGRAQQAEPSPPTESAPTQTAVPAGAAPQPSPTPDAAPEAGAEQASLTLVRRSEKDGKDRRILIVKTGTDDTTGVFALCQPLPDDPEGAPTLAVFSETGAGGVQITIDKNVIRVPLAVVTQNAPKDGQDGSDGRVEASAGTGRFLEREEVPPDTKDRLTRCEVQAVPKPAPDTVLVTQGRTELRGQKLVYDSADGVARIDGPIKFTRRSDTDPLTGQSDRIEVSVDDEKTTLVGNVVFNSAGGRVSRAARVEYDDTRNVARLYGTAEQPAESVKGGDTLRAGVIVYDLDRNEVYAMKAEGSTITGEFTDTDTPDVAAPGSATPASAPAAPAGGQPASPVPTDPLPPVNPAPVNPAPVDPGPVSPGSPAIP
ncbi:LptA/OstA family protein [Deinococcus aquaticus]|uniref:OstA family protein n=1 Tax=Deinococcus aquaticus TaxID=328692 RepID=A0ABY7V6Z2_9DEIO|nr:LptA/OstA family protein [Deinococcus aquaticus]WDA59722.1 OstA family protein [Deinococcus aquaticus]